MARALQTHAENQQTLPQGTLDSECRSVLTGLRSLSRIQELEGARWGGLLTPAAPAILPPRNAGGFRLVLFGSFWIGHAALRAALAYQRSGPGAAQLVGVSTDDPISRGARISLRKRAWGLMAEPERRSVKLALVGAALDAGVPVHTGEIKTPGFRRLLAEWRPDAIITCGFGQVLDRAILDTVPYGAYNCHPTDLANGHGAGPSPWDDMVERGVHHTVWSVHQMTEVVDAGPVIGQTPPINVADAKGRLPDDRRSFFYKVVPPIGWMVLRLLDTLVQRKEQGLPGRLTQIDLNAGMPPGLRQRIAEPVAPDWEAASIPEPGAEEFAALRTDAAMGRVGRLTG
jgi:hypothetical protein